MKNENKNNKNSGKIILIVAAGILGLVLLLFGGYSEKKDDASETEPSESYSSVDAEEYARDAERRIAELCSSVSGVSNVRVMVTLSGGYNAVYAQNSQSSSSGYRNEFVLTGNGSSERPLLIGYTVPRISGVGIVCRGGGEDAVRREIISLVSAAYGLGANNIYVAESS